ncbi:MAG: efflux RND transporter periplasmic adaptor subunit [Gammaproteobacteria bacterium]|nr:MAG: efflux RND transporter periplasmic adaptor subunit [Gammaproteobacteria bacterium]
MKILAVLIMGLVLAACGQSDADKVETVLVGSGLFEITLRAKGELRAAESTPIKPPPGSRTPRTIEWMVPDNSWVTKGELIARFDASSAERGTREVGIELSKVDIQVLSKQRELQRQLGELGNELELVDIEKIMAEEFSVDNELAYSRYEIIDAMRDKELLDYRADHLEGKKDTYRDREGAEVAVLNAARATQESKFQEHRIQLESSEIRAPHDGFFVYEKTWFGQKIGIGSTVFPGNKIASIPNLGKMEAVLQVLETEAVGIVKGQSAVVIIDAFPDRPLSGTISKISATASPIERNSPVKYFVVTVTLDKANPDWITPESQVAATIAINRIEDTIFVPNQAIFSDSSGDWVLIRKGRDLEKQEIELGLRGANRSQIISGLEKNAEIALFPPGENSS